MSRLQACRQLYDLAITYHPTDIHYFLRISISQGKLFIHRKGTYLFLDGRYFHTHRDLPGIHVLEDSPMSIQKTLSALSYQECVVDFDQLTHRDFLEIQKSVGNSSLRDVPFAIQLRAEKEPEEMQWMRDSAQLNHLGLLRVKKRLVVGISEKEAAWIYEEFVRANGASGVSFPPIVAFGKNTAEVHHRPDKNTILQKNDPVLIDCGCIYKNYASDMTRSFLFGVENEHYLQVLRLVQEAQNIGIKALRKGIEAQEPEVCVRKFLSIHSMEKFFTHSLGHSIGLEVHENPRLRLGVSTLIRKNMIFTVEPGIYIEGKFGVRCEDTVVINENGAHLLDMEK